MRREWTEWEEKYMERKYLRQPVKVTAERLNRTVVSVKRKAAKMHLNHNIDCLSAKEVSRCFNCDISVILRWIEKLDMPARKFNDGRYTRYDIDSQLFWKWAENHKNQINFNKYQLGSLLPEPEWVRVEKRDYKTYKSRMKYEAEEKRKIKNMIMKGMSYKEISEELGRTYYGIVHVGRTIFK